MLISIFLVGASFFLGGFLLYVYFTMPVGFYDQQGVAVRMEIEMLLNELFEDQDELYVDNFGFPYWSINEGWKMGSKVEVFGVKNQELRSRIILNVTEKLKSDGYADVWLSFWDAYLPDEDLDAQKASLVETQRIRFNGE